MSKKTRKVILRKEEEKKAKELTDYDKETLRLERLQTVIATIQLILTILIFYRD